MKAVQAKILADAYQIKRFKIEKVDTKRLHRIESRILIESKKGEYCLVVEGKLSNPIRTILEANGYSISEFTSVIRTGTIINWE